MVRAPLSIAEVRLGKFCRLLGPESLSPASFGVTPSSPSAIPKAPLLKMELAWTVFRTPFCEIRTPSPPLSRRTLLATRLSLLPLISRIPASFCPAIRFPSGALLPPTELFATLITQTPMLSRPARTFPNESVPIRFPCTVLFPELRATLTWCPLMTLPSPGILPPTTVPEAPESTTKMPSDAFGNNAVPAAFRPMKLPRITLFAELAPKLEISIAWSLLPDITFRSAAVIPPIWFPEERIIFIPSSPLASAAIPEASVPMRFPATVLFSVLAAGFTVPSMSTPWNVFPEIRLAPTTICEAPSIIMPLSPLGKAEAPVASVPM